jgi:hypothetical protein
MESVVVWQIVSLEACSHVICGVLISLWHVPNPVLGFDVVAIESSGEDALGCSSATALQRRARESFYSNR